MADDTIFNYDDIADLRYNPFTNTYTPKKIGYGIIPPEVRTVPTTAPYQIKLFESPQENVPSTTAIETTVGGTPLREVSFNQTPASNEYRVCYDELGNGIVEFNAAQKGVQMNISYYGLGSIIQKQALATKLEATFTVTLAANDSEASSKESADYILGVGEDVGAIINNLIAGFSNGGEIKLFEGTYSVKTIILPDNYTKIIGSGDCTVFKREAAIKQVIYINAKSFVTLSDFKIDGNKSTYTGSAYYGIEGTGDETKGNRFENLTSNNNEDYGFIGCNWMNNCKATSNDTYGFTGCNEIMNCYAASNGTGFYNCERITSCEAKSNSNGFSACYYIINSKAYLNITYGFLNCHSLGHNHSNNIGFNYTTSYADYLSANPANDTAAGGYNS